MDEIKKNSILVVDDEHSNILALIHMLGQKYTVYAKKSGKEAIETAEEIVPDLILLDVLMPEMDGYEVISTLKKSEKTKDIPVIFISGLRETEDEKKGLALGAADYIGKPFVPEIVELRVRNQIQMVNLMRSNIEKERAERNNRARIDFLVRMNHEMLTPMNAIMGIMQVLKLQINKIRDIPDKTKIHLDEVESASRYLLGLIHDLLDISGQNEGTFVLSSASFSFNNMIEKILKGIEPETDKKQQKIITEIDQAIPGSLIGDEKRLAQVITNLLKNAVKFTQESGEIKFSSRILEEDNESVVLLSQVTDNGIGMSKEQQDEIFSIFEQGEGSMTRIRGGIGLGLPICKRIVEMMDGKIWVESEPDKGAAFMFTVRLKKGSE